MYEMDFASRLSKLREEKGVSAREMSLDIGQNHGYINSIENGKNLPTMRGFFYICDYLGITPEEFFRKDIPYPQELRKLVEDLSKLNKDDLKAIQTIVASMTNDKKQV